MHSRGGLWQLKVRKNFIEWKWYCFYINLIEIIFDFSVILYTCYAVICTRESDSPSCVIVFESTQIHILYSSNAQMVRYLFRMKKFYYFLFLFRFVMGRTSECVSCEGICWCAEYASLCQSGSGGCQQHQGGNKNSGPVRGAHLHLNLVTLDTISL